MKNEMNGKNERMHDNTQQYSVGLNMHHESVTFNLDHTQVFMNKRAKYF
jgi:hypothetical protein